jgi:MYXO-CTERM domain-containing protein
VPELEKRYIRAIAGDPIEPKRTYVVTTNAMVDNGIYMNDGTGSFVEFGAQARMFIASLHVVKNAEKRRFYETGVTTNAETNTVSYSVRVSDDEATTWTDEAFDPVQFETTEKRVQEFKLVAIDPTDPDRVVGLVVRPDRAPDSLVFSRDKGKAGTWERIAEPLLAGAVAFGPDGVLYFGDDNFASKGLFKVSQLGEAPQLISDVYRVSCLGYDAARSRLLGCADNYRFGAFDTSSGELTTLLDLRCAEHVVTCPDNPEIQTLCQPPGVEFCKLDHWVIAPLCCVYERADFDTFATSQDIVCEGGVAKQKPAAAGEGGAPQYCPKPAAGSGGAAGSSGAVAAGSGGTEGGTDKAAGCGCSSVASAAPGRAATFLALGLFVLCARRHRRRHSGRICFLP